MKNTKTASLLHLPGVGKQVAHHLARLGILTLQDLLFHFPFRYQDRTQLHSIRHLKEGEEAVVEGTIVNVQRPQRGRTKLLCELQDETGRLTLRFFHILPFQLKLFTIGTRLRCYGVVRLNVKGKEMFHPEFKVVTNTLPLETHLTPIYHATEGLSQHRLRKLTAHALTWMRHAKNFSDEIPASFAQAFSLADLHTALQFLHQPPRETNLSELTEYKTVAHKRLIFEELLAHRLSLLQLKKHFQQQKAPALSLSEEKIKLFLGNLSFQLTAAQRRVLSEIQNDLTQSSPMLRLVQGDVGSGKTIIAALAMLQAVTNGYQAVMMAPTELLAEQHYHVMQHWFAPLSVEVVFLSSQVKGRAREKVFHQIKNKTAHIVVGTHALYQEDVEFADLALIVIDEQHRFGVEQRVSLREKGRKLFYPHQLMLTATPIPRTLAMRFYADLDCSIIDELPPGRTPIFTSVMPSHKRDDIILRIREACQQGRQVYWVCPLIEESEVLSCQSAITTSKILQQQLSEIKIGLVHGRMRAQEKENIMRAFKKNELHLLVATTVIEVGVDVPNASVMIIENAERLGLSQLHQLRGRVGRGTAVSHCILLYQHLSDIAKQRLSVMRETTDGFKIAECDLSLRGPGEVLGLRQTGDLSFRVADLLRDQALLTDVQHAADIILRDHPECVPTLIARWVGNEMNYG